MARRWMAALAALALVSSAGAEVTDQALSLLTEARRQAGVPPLERDPALDALALERAEQIADRPADQRLGGRTPIVRLLHASGDGRVLDAWERLDLSRGERQPARRLIERWQHAAGAWRRALAPTATRIGLASARSPDGWQVVLAIITEDRPTPFDAEGWERALLEAVNHLRRERGIGALTFDPELAAVARRHSEDMAANDFFDHRDPEGRALAYRLRDAGVRRGRVAENIAVNRGLIDPVAAAVESWDNSPRHLETMIDPSFDRSGVGIARSTDGRLYFTQLFASSGEEP